MDAPRSLDLFLPLDAAAEDVADSAGRALGWSRDDVGEVAVVRRSLDARKGHPIGWQLKLLVARKGQSIARPTVGLPAPARLSRVPRVVVVGSGPAGTFAALRLAEAGVAATLVERGKPVQPRRRDLASLLQRGALSPDSNYCFGEGGAGTFSDGKLYTRAKDKRGVEEILKTLVAHGADPAIEVESRPHIGSNRLPEILVAIRTHLEARGARYIWGDPVEDLAIEGGRMAAVRLRSGEELPADAVVLAVGHSARPMYELLHRRGVPLVAKAFAVGARVEHPQPLIDRLQYGRAASHPSLPAAFYHVTATVPTGGEERGVYSFCMCPGGWIVAAATEPDGLCVNGMSLKRRDSPFADSALVVTVEPRDFGGDDPLAGVRFQQRLERAAFAAGGGGYRAPAQRVVDFLAGRASPAPLPSSYRPGLSPARLDELLPGYVTDGLRGALRRWERALPGFAGGSAQLVGVETRTSAPVRILRDAQSLQSPGVAGLYPTGEGAGFAGGIVSAALDGLRVADALLAVYR